VLDGPSGSELRPLRAQSPSVAAAAPRQVTLLTIVQGWKPDAERWLLSVFTHCKADFEALVIDSSGDERITSWLDSRAAERLRVVRVDPQLGFGAAVNAGIDAAAGDICVLIDQSVELKGDAITPLLSALEDASVVVAGPFGMRAKGTLKEFEESTGPDVDAIEGYCMAFRRADALAAGGLDPKFRFYRIADIELSFRLREKGGRAVVLPDLPLVRHEHRIWEATEPAERDRLSRRNLYRFLDRWRDRTDLMVGRS